MSYIDTVGKWDVVPDWHGGKKVFGKEEGEYVDFEEVKE